MDDSSKDQLSRFKAAFQKYLDVYMTGRNLDMLEEMVSENFRGFGTGVDEKIHSKARAMEIFDRDIKSAPGELHYDIHRHEINLLDQSNALAVTELNLKTNIADQEIKLNNLRMMMVLHEEAGIVKISGIHISFPTEVHAEGESYPLIELEERNKVLSRMVEEKTKKQQEIICQLQNAEEAQRKSEEELKTVINNISDVVAIADVEGIFTYISESSRAVFGYKPEELVDKSILELVHEDDILRVSSVFHEGIDEGKKSASIEHRVRNKNGSYIWVEARGNLMVDDKGQPLGVLFVSRDISARKKAEEALRVSEEKYRQITENISDVVWITDAQLNTVYISPSVEKLIGESVDYQMNRSMEERFPPDSLNKLLNTFQEEMDKEKDPLSDKNRSRVIEVQQYKADGEIIWISMHISTIRDKDGKITGLQGVTRDITDRKKAEEALKLQASERAAVDTFTYSVSNDLQAPLRRIEGFSEALLEECADQLNDQARDYLNRIVTQVSSMKKLTDALLQLSRVVTREIYRERVDLSALIRSNLEKLQYEEPGRRVDSVIAPEVIVEGDAELLNLVIANLLDNAWKFASASEEACIEFGSAEQDGRTVCYLKDNGVGFDMKHAGKLFAPFQKLHSENDYPGIGIGLNLVYRIISLHGGEIWAEGEPGKGACFYFTLP